MGASFTGHLTGLPQDILVLFQPGPLLTYLTPISKINRNSVDGGIVSYVKSLNHPVNYADKVKYYKEYMKNEYKYQTRIYKKDTLIINNKKSFAPMYDPNIDGNPFKTLFVGRLSHNVSEWRLRREFEEFGPLSRIRIVADKLTGKKRGYAFIEFERLENMKTAYKIGMNRNIEGKKIIVDVERGRTVANWKPKRLGGGIGYKKRIAHKMTTLDSTTVTPAKHY